MIYLVSYDLNKPSKDYEKLYQTLKSAPGWWHYLESTWIISTNKSVKHWSEKIQNSIDDNDDFLIVDITGQPRNGWLPKKAWEWIKKHNN